MDLLLKLLDPLTVLLDRVDRGFARELSDLGIVLLVVENERDVEALSVLDEDGQAGLVNGVALYGRVVELVDRLAVPLKLLPCPVALLAQVLDLPLQTLSFLPLCFLSLSSLPPT